MGDSERLAHIPTRRKSGKEQFHRSGQDEGFDLLSFWQWTGSHLLSNVSRGNFAEYIVASALGVADGVRATWDAFDLTTRSDIKVEVKSSAYVQMWEQVRLYRPTFEIRLSHGWDGDAQGRTTVRQRHADVYVFCLLHHKDRDTIDPLDLDQWTFYVLRTSVLNEQCGDNKTISLGRLQKLGARRVPYDRLAHAIEAEGVLSRATY